MAACQSVEEFQDLERQLKEKLELGQKLLDTLQHPSLRHIHGLAKLEKKIRQEMKFLQKFLKEKRSKLKKEHLNCSNLLHLSATVGVLTESQNPKAVLQTFPVDFHYGNTKRIVVDVVSDDGFNWFKVIARNPKALDLNSTGGNQFGQRSLLDQVKEFLECAKQNPKMFRTPSVTFFFHNGISQSLAYKLERRGLVVKGDIVPSDLDVESDVDDGTDDSDTDSEVIVPKKVDFTVTTDRAQNGELDASCINLDITAMIAYVSALTNGHSGYNFREPILLEQARWEQEKPVKPFLEDLFRNKRLICCESAMADFKTILNTLGGQGEKERAENFSQRIEVVPDMMTDRLRHLDMSGKIKERSRAIFGTGDHLKVLTVSANSGFVRAAKGQGVELAVILHESRALTEDKMLSSETWNENQ